MKLSETASKFLNLIEGGYWELDDDAVSWASNEGRDAVSDYGAELLTSEGHEEFSSREAGRATLQAAENAGIRTLAQLKDFINWEEDGEEEGGGMLQVGDAVRHVPTGVEGVVSDASALKLRKPPSETLIGVRFNEPFTDPSSGISYDGKWLWLSDVERI